MPGFVIVESADERVGLGLLGTLVARLSHAPRCRTKIVAARPYYAGIVTLGQEPDDYCLEAEGQIYLGYGFLDGQSLAVSFRDQLAGAVAAGGEHFFRHLRGHFSVAGLYPASGRCCVATNRFGSVPVFWADNGQVRVWAPEIPACLAVAGVSRDLDPVFIAESLLLDAPLGNRTPFAAVHHLPPATVAWSDRGGIRTEKYWFYRFYGGTSSTGSGAGQDEGELLDQAALLTRRAVDKVLDADRPISLFLSGGLDSRTVLGAALPASPRLRTISFGARGCWDLRLGREVSAAAGVADHVAAPLDPWRYVDVHEEGINLTGGMLTFMHMHLFGFARSYGRPGELFLTGFLGDPHFGADSRLDRREPGDPDAVVERFYGALGLEHPVFAPLCGDATRAAIKADLRAIMAECVRHNQPLDFHEYYFVAVRQPNLIIFINALLGTLYEVRMPFLDYDLAEFWCTLPERWRNKRRLQRALVAREWPTLASVPESDTFAPVTASSARARWALAARRSRRALQLGVELLSRGHLSPSYPRQGERHAANLNGHLRQWLLANIAELEQTSLFPDRALDPFKKRLLGVRDARQVVARGRLISLAGILRWRSRWPQQTGEPAQWLTDFHAPQRNSGVR